MWEIALQTRLRIDAPVQVHPIDVECRYDLGSGAAVIRSAERLQLNRFHTVLARRFRRDGILSVDSGTPVSGTSPGLLRSLNVLTPFYVGYIPDVNTRSVAV